MRETIDISRIKQQEDICAEIFETVTADGKRPLAMVDTYGCQPVSYTHLRAHET